MDTLHIHARDIFVNPERLAEMLGEAFRAANLPDVPIVLEHKTSTYACNIPLSDCFDRSRFIGELARLIAQGKGDYSIDRYAELLVPNDEGIHALLINSPREAGGEYHVATPG